MTTIALNVRAQNLIKAAERFEKPQGAAQAVVNAVYTRQDQGNWKLFMAQCVVGATSEETETEDIYRNHAFVTKLVSDFRMSFFLEELQGQGFCISNGLPRLRDDEGNANWAEDIVPSHATGTSSPARRFSAKIEDGSHFHDGQLVGYGKSYHKSAKRFIGEFLALGQFHGHADARKGEISIQIPDERGAITLTSECLGFVGNSKELAVVGQLNENTPVVLSACDKTRRIDPEELGDVQLWLVTSDDEIVDYRSSTEWPYQFENMRDMANYEENLRNIIQYGESETCEFKKFIRLNDKRKSQDFEKTVCAFSNLRGGVLFIGVDDEGEVVGLEEEVEKTYKTNSEEAATLYVKEIDKRLKETLRDTLCFSIEVNRVLMNMIVVITVTRASETNYLHRSNEAYIRRGATNRKMSPPEIQEQPMKQRFDSY